MKTIPKKDFYQNLKIDKSKDKMESYWDTANGHGPHPVKYESEAPVSGFTYCSDAGLNFSTSQATYSEDDTEYTPGRRGKTSRQDPLSHRIIEKRRRDRMNSCLADLSRLIPTQYLRKGRGRVEKTEIIEMAIRHMKHLQTQEYVNKETVCTEQYRLGYQECLSEAAKFLLSGHLKEICIQLVEHLKEHCNEIIKDFSKTRHNSNTDTINTVNENQNGYYPPPPINQIRDMITSDVEHSNSNDNHDIKDLSFRIIPQPVPMISSGTSVIHIETSNNTSSSNSSEQNIKTNSNGNHSQTLQCSSDSNIHESVLRTVRMRKFSETCTEMEHNNNYKYKNYIQQKFSQDNHMHHAENNNNMNGCNNQNHDSDNIANNNYSNSNDNNNNSNSSNLIKNNKNVQNNNSMKAETNSNTINSNNSNTKKRKSESIDYRNDGEKPVSNCIPEIKSELISSNPMATIQSIQKSSKQQHAYSVPIFALHAQGTYYVPLNVDYETLIPFLGGIDLLDNNFNSIPPLHPININVCFSHTLIKSLPRPKIENISNGW